MGGWRGGDEICMGKRKIICICVLVFPYELRRWYGVLRTLDEVQVNCGSMIYERKIMFFFFLLLLFLIIPCLCSGVSSMNYVSGVCVCTWTVRDKYNDHVYPVFVSKILLSAFLPI